MIIVENDKEDEEKTIRYLFAMPQGRVSIMCCFFQYIGKYVVAFVNAWINYSKIWPLSQGVFWIFKYIFI